MLSTKMKNKKRKNMYQNSRSKNPRSFILNQVWNNLIKMNFLLMKVISLCFHLIITQ